MTTQDYAHHTRLVPLFHGVLAGLLLLTLIGSIVNLVHEIGVGHGRGNAVLLVLLTISGGLLFFFCRTFPLKAQDRAIRAEENLRHFALTGKLLDPRITMAQVIALRFAPDDEFVPLAKKAAETNMSNDEIKRAVKNWRADEHRA